ncbi:hypothetical protein, partial [Ellagibacter isourolithinifaciens]|uniref:hypothetical protein n=1 Tax=Ellagibacter isourolithinifaciens TaxID=2137581 RepID=UPI0023F520A0
HSERVKKRRIKSHRELAIWRAFSFFWGDGKKARPYEAGARSREKHGTVNSFEQIQPAASYPLP